MPGRLRIGKTKFSSECLTHRYAIFAERRQRAGGASELHNQGFFKAVVKSFPPAMDSPEPSGSFESKCDWPGSLQKRPAQHYCVGVLLGQAMQSYFKPKQIRFQNGFCFFEKQHKRCITNILAGRAPMDKSGGIWIFAANTFNQCFHQRNAEGS